MILLTNTDALILAPGQTATFDKVILHTGCGEYHRNNTGAIKMRFDGVYSAGFSANVANPNTAAAVELTLAIDGAPMPETTRISTPTAAGAVNCIGAETLIKNGGSCCCGSDDYGTVTLINTGVTTIAVGAGANLWIRRES